MADIKKAQDEAIAYVDTAKAMVDKVLQIMEIFLVSPSMTVTYSRNPMEFIMKLLKAVGVSEEELIDFLTYILLGALPALEIGVKTILLTNLKHLVSCSVDPRIPEKYRKRHKDSSDPDTSQLNGIDIDITSIDFLDKLSVSPKSDAGSQYYFGLEGVTDSYQFARADDMDAFLWFVIHKGKFPMATTINAMSDFTNSIHGVGADRVEPSDATLLSAFEVIYSSENSSKILNGNTFTYTGNSRIISMCAESKYDDNDKITHNTILPVSDDRTSVNWYIRRADQLTKNLGIGWNSKKAKSATKSGRDFSKERAICNIQFIESLPNASLAGLVNNKFRFTILPKPLIHIPSLSNGEPPWRFKKMLFDDKGNYDPNGKFTIADVSDDENLSYLDGAVTIDAKSGKVTVSDKDKVIKNLVECYPGLTVYEFNYDYVMGMKLFDAKTLATTLFNNLMDIRLGISADISIKHQEATDEIKKIVKEIIETDDSEVSDCFFSFDNSKYSALMRLAEERRVNILKANSGAREGYDKLVDIINEFDENATLNEQKDVLKRAITQASVTVSGGLPESDKLNVEFNFVADLIQNLVEAIVYSLLSPKVMMLLEVNEELMGGRWEKFTMRDLLMAMRSIIIAVVKEIRDLILQELMRLLNEKLQPIIEMLSSIILREQIENYTKAINDLIRNCPFIWFRFGSENQETKLDTVDYADIDVSSNKTGDSPNIC